MKKDVMMYCVYKHTSPQGKIYIGITSLMPERRWKKGKGYKENKRFYDDIMRFGWDSFTHEILYDDLSCAAANIIEMDLIEELDTTNPLKGYNRNSGGDCNMQYRTTRKIREIYQEYANPYNDEMQFSICEEQDSTIKKLESRIKSLDSRIEQLLNEKEYDKKLAEIHIKSLKESIRDRDTQIQEQDTLIRLKNESIENLIKSIRLSQDKCLSHQKIAITEKEKLQRVLNAIKRKKLMWLFKKDLDDKSRARYADRTRQRGM